MDLLTSIILVAALGNLFLGTFVLLKNRSDSINRSFGFFGITTGLWVFVNFLYEVTTMEFFLRLAYSFGSLIPISAVIWIYFFENVKIPTLSKNFIKIAILVGIFFFVLSYLNNYIVETKNLVIKTGGLFQFYAIYIFFVVIWGLTKIFVIFTKSTGLKKEQSKYILFGLVAFSLATIIVSVILPSFDIIAFSKLDSPSTLFFIGFSTFALVRHRLFNIQVIITEFLVIIVGIILLIDLLTSKTLSIIILKAGILVAFIYIGILLLQSVYKEIERRQEIEKIDKAKSEFISIASHQLRTPLTAIKGYISMIIEGTYGKLSEKAQKPMENVYQSNERLIRLVNDLLNLSRLDAGKIEFSPGLISLQEMVASIVEEMKINAENKGL
jgi:signal transduction histidine kinase